MRAVAAAVVSVWLAGSSALGWTPMLEISHASANERSTPRIARGASGNLHVVYINKGSPWRVYYRQKSVAGNWGPVEVISSTADSSTRPEVTEDGQGRAHIFYAQYLTAGALDLVHVYRNGGSWTSEVLTSTADYEDQPHVVTDASGRIHLLFTRGAQESSTANIIYRVWNGSSWGDETPMGHTDNAYFRRPDLCIDSAGNLHAVWGDKSGSLFKIRYAKYNGNTWSSPVDVGSAAGTWPNCVKVSAASPSNIMVVWDDENVTYNYSNNGGATWAFGLSGSTQGQVLSGDRSPSLTSASSVEPDGGLGLVHLISTAAPNNRGISYSQWNGSTWAVLGQAVWANTMWKGWTDVVADPGGNIHAVWDEAYGSETNEHLIGYSSSLADAVPPVAPVFTATAGHNHVSLNWTNPSDPDFERTVIRVSTMGYPNSPTGGESLVDRAAAPGSTDSFEHTTVVNGTRYYYAAFAKDIGGLYSPAARATAKPFVPPDLDLDNDVDMSDFAIFQLCLSGSFTPQTDPNCAQALFDADTDVDQDDATIFMGCLSGADVKYAPGCAD